MVIKTFCLLLLAALAISISCHLTEPTADQIENPLVATPANIKNYPLQVVVMELTPTKITESIRIDFKDRGIHERKIYNTAENVEIYTWMTLGINEPVELEGQVIATEKGYALAADNRRFNLSKI